MFPINLYTHKIAREPGLVLQGVKDSNEKNRGRGRKLSIGLLAIVFTEPFSDIPGTAEHVEGHDQDVR